MGINVVDRRNNPKGKSSENRQRIIKRVEDQIKKALPDIIKNTNVKDLTSSKKGVKVPVKGISEPQFTYDRNSGDKKHVHPGNKEYVEGDKVKKNDGGEGKGKGKKGSNDPTITEDDFTITISKDEFLEYFFNELELPDMVKKHLNQIVDFKQKRSGYSNYGNPSRLNIVKSFKNSMTRRMANGLFYDKKIKEIEEKLKDQRLTDQDRIHLEKELDKLKKMKLSVSFMEEVDLQYNNFEKYPVPVTSAVMFCIMDVSGSMGENEKDISKRFFMLLYMFLTKQYEKIEMVFIRHHTDAKEVSEDEFFNSKESGGTVVITALELLDKIIRERYSDEWNIYVAQASDGDVWDDSDATDCYKILNSEILRKVQYMVYIDICKDEYRESDLYQKYKLLSDKKQNFNIGKIFEVSDIWKVFQEFFKKKVG
jgi:uncharacterized sporulation protein YeaH/YhbH (DUF444 family)